MCFNMSPNSFGKRSKRFLRAKGFCKQKWHDQLQQLDGEAQVEGLDDGKFLKNQLVILQ